MFRKTLANIHWLIGITLGTVLAIVGATGAIMVFSDEIVATLNGHPDRVTPAGTALDINEIYRKINEQNPGKNIAWLAIPADPAQAIRVDFVRAARRGPTEDESGERVNPFTGEMMHVSTERGRAFMQSVEGLHRRLTFSRPSGGDAPAPMPGGPTPGAQGSTSPQGMMGQMGPAGGQPPGGGRPAASWGVLATSYAVLGLMVMAISGLYLRWPRRKASDWRSWFKINFKLKGFAFNYNLHAVVGTCVLLGYLISAHTGLMMSEMRWYTNGVNTLVGRNDNRGGGGGGPGGGPGLFGDAAINRNSYDLNAIWQNFKREVPSFDTATLQFSRSNAGEFQITYLQSKQVTSHGVSGSSTVLFDAATSAVKSHRRFTDNPVAQQLVMRNFDLHSGSYFGLPGRIFILLTSVMMPVLFVTGWLQYLAKQKQKRKRAAALVATEKAAA